MKASWNVVGGRKKIVLWPLMALAPFMGGRCNMSCFGPVKMVWSRCLDLRQACVLCLSVLDRSFDVGLISSRFVIQCGTGVFCVSISSFFLGVV